MSSSPHVALRLLGRALALACLCAPLACKDPPPAPLAGLYAVRGSGLIVREAEHDQRRTARAGLTVGTDGTLVLEKGAQVVLEGYNGAFLLLEAGEHAVGKLRVLKADTSAKRDVLWVENGAQKRSVAALVSSSRYEPMPMPVVVEPKDEMGENMAFFFLPHSDKEAAAPPPPPTSPWVAAAAYVRPLRRPLAQGPKARTLVKATGAVVVEFKDHATAFASELPLPLDLEDVERVVVVEGEAELRLADGSAHELDEGEVAEIR